MAPLNKLPSRLHHNAYVTKDQEKTRQFYEDVIGLPLLATWCESDELFGKVRTYVHTFYGIGDGGALAFFQFADPADQEEFGPKMPPTPFHHIALRVDAET
ncbi:MAG TPA: VOC family protein, partial [Steroidobacteraceae bacterium]